MPGVPGAGGPVPKRSNQKHGHRTHAEKDLVVKAEGAAEVEPPKANSKWHPAAKRWYESLALSGQSAFYEPSDWGLAYVVAENLSRELKPQPIGVNEDGEPVIASVPMKGAAMASFLKACSSLLVTEGDRRRARMELERPMSGSEEASDVSWLDEARRRREDSG